MYLNDLNIPLDDLANKLSFKLAITFKSQHISFTSLDKRLSLLPAAYHNLAKDFIIDILSEESPQAIWIKKDVSLTDFDCCCIVQKEISLDTLLLKLVDILDAASQTKLNVTNLQLFENDKKIKEDTVLLFDIWYALTSSTYEEIKEKWNKDIDVFLERLRYKPKFIKILILYRSNQTGKADSELKENFEKLHSWKIRDIELKIICQMSVVMDGLYCRAFNLKDISYNALFEEFFKLKKENLRLKDEIKELQHGSNKKRMYKLYE